MQQMWLPGTSAKHMVKNAITVVEKAISLVSVENLRDSAMGKITMLPEIVGNSQGSNLSHTMAPHLTEEAWNTAAKDLKAETEKTITRK